jgi:methanogenic corrinoid protein MtbC1
MLRLAPLDVAGDGAASLAVTPALITRALGDLVSERIGSATSGFAIEQLCAALLDDAPRAAQAYVDRLLDCGVGIEALYDAYIPRAAARLGEMWLDDRLPFAGVTLGMARLTEVFRRLSPSFLRERPDERPEAEARGRRALFALTPGESHALGVVMAADYFQRGGWSVRVELTTDAAGLERIVRERPFDLVGLSAGSRRMIPELRRTVARLRAAAWPGARFALGGALVGLERDPAGLVGVDLAHGSAAEALEQLERGLV